MICNRRALLAVAAIKSAFTKIRTLWVCLAFLAVTSIALRTLTEAGRAERVLLALSALTVTTGITTIAVSPLRAARTRLAVGGEVSCTEVAASRKWRTLTAPAMDARA